jgi:hypothetical protein
MANVTVVTWAFAPDWLSVAEAVALSGHDEATVLWLVGDGALETRKDGETWLIEKNSLWEFQHALLDVREL